MRNLPKTDRYLEAKYPNLAHSGYEIKGSATRQYNCANLADNERWRWIQPTRSTKGLIRYFERKNWSVCEDGELREGYFKLAIYVNVYGEWRHIAVRQTNGKWLSKLGEGVLIEHNTLAALEGFSESAYGIVKIYMERPRKSTDP